MIKDMEKVKNIMIMEELNMKVIMLMGKEMEKEKNIIMVEV